MAIHERVWERDQERPTSRRAGHGAAAWKPMASYVLLGTLAAVFILQLVVNAYSPAWHDYLFVIRPDFLVAPWTLITSTLSHANLSHIAFNALFLVFFGPALERIWGWKRFTLWFLVAGALSGVLQVLITGGGALGASGALMMVFGALVVLMPNEKILVWGIVPVPFWVAGFAYALIDVAGAMSGGSRIGHFAHLSGLALGLALGWWTKQDMARRGLVLVRA